MVPFAGYDMPVQYPTGILTEHKHTRAAAGLFDVSHMGQVKMTGADVAKALETLVPGDIQALDVGKMRYTVFTNDKAGILDDFMVNKRDRDLFVVFNAGCKDADLAHARAHLKGVEIEYLESHALLALQGPAAVEVLSRLNSAVPASGPLAITLSSPVKTSQASGPSMSESSRVLQICSPSSSRVVLVGLCMLSCCGNNRSSGMREAVPPTSSTPASSTSLACAANAAAATAMSPPPGTSAM